MRMFITMNSYIPKRKRVTDISGNLTRYVVLRKGRKYLPKQWTAECNTDQVGRIHPETERIKQRVAEATSHLLGRRTIVLLELNTH